MKRINNITRLGFIWFLSLFITVNVKAATKKNINQRVNTVREKLIKKPEKNNSIKNVNPFTAETLDQWYNWGNWANWNNWNNWANWGNWGNWSDWYNY